MISAARGVTRVARERNSPNPLYAMATPNAPPVRLMHRLSVAS